MLAFNVVEPGEPGDGKIVGARLVVKFRHGGVVALAAASPEW